MTTRISGGDQERRPKEAKQQWEFTEYRDQESAPVLISDLYPSAQNLNSTQTVTTKKHEPLLGHPTGH